MVLESSTLKIDGVRSSETSENLFNDAELHSAILVMHAVDLFEILTSFTNIGVRTMYQKDRGSRFLRNVGNLLRYCAAFRSLCKSY
jgi:hypothetical protein